MVRATCGAFIRCLLSRLANQRATHTLHRMCKKNRKNTKQKNHRTHQHTRNGAPLAAVAAALVATLRIRHVSPQLSCLRIGRRRVLALMGKNLAGNYLKLPRQPETQIRRSPAQLSQQLFTDTRTHTHIPTSRRLYLYLYS